MCGENVKWYKVRETSSGSPPRVRGKRSPVDALSHDVRITPACAGKTYQENSDFLPAEDHPRVCGENPDTLILHGIPAGSPPRVRGKPIPARLKISPSRITPACAGKTARNGRRAPRNEDHPRVCGENFVPPTFSLVDLGSPPRVRGKPLASSTPGTSRRITPACAGKTFFTKYSSKARQDHPRVCGENIQKALEDYAELGSPPRVRGKPLTMVSFPPAARITPACAGKTP